MAAGLQPPVGEPLGFPGCPECPYLQGGSSLVCFTCASKVFGSIAAKACSVCSQYLEPNGTCRNWLCLDPTRRIERIDAIAYFSGPLHSKILSYKSENKFGWAAIFGRVLVGWLERHLSLEMPDLIVANPTWVEPGSIFPLGHTERVLEAAGREDVTSQWNFDIGSPRAITKTRGTAKSAGSAASAKRAAALELRSVLAITNAGLVAGKRILIYDDVCTTGAQLNEVAGCLFDDGGAVEVKAVVLARAPWRPRPTPR